MTVFWTGMPILKETLLKQENKRLRFCELHSGEGMLRFPNQLVTTRRVSGDYGPVTTCYEPDVMGQGVFNEGALFRSDFPSLGELSEGQA
ncbi:hypothetical protein ACFOHK_16470 [Falsigemmobacter intermedius]|uniref:Uncharacterized protein n=1 Tax=Falsigemmobacter intermedius TaxID=1553448 RepID=A0A444M8B0_9RHOB|nr:hypothetical protein [Falsigemmobacter intermedius]RWY34936.1 hypothetical protein EP867_19040 [Falsigemmobacter intermedius]